MASDSEDFNAHVDMMEIIVDYHTMLFSSTGEVRIPLDLWKFSNPRKVINSVKLQYSLKNESDVESDVWIAKVSFCFMFLYL